MLIAWLVEDLQEIAEGLPRDFELARSSIFPRIVLRTSLATVRLGGENPLLPKHETPYALLSNEFAIELLFQFSHSNRCLQTADFEAWGVSFDEALRMAIGNLERVAPDFEKAAEGGLYSVHRHSYIGRSYIGSAFILLTESIRQLELIGRPVAMIPNQGILLITGSEDCPGIYRMAQLSELMFAHGDQFGGVPHQLVDGQWKTYQLPTDHPAYLMFRQLRLEAAQCE